MTSPDDEKPHRSTALDGCTAGLLGLVLTFVLVNLLGALLFHNHPSYGSAQGLGSIFTYLSMVCAPLGALHWRAVVNEMREAENPRRAVLTRAAIYILLLLAAVLGIGWSYAWSYGPR
jgi:hypothetical protein